MTEKEKSAIYDGGKNIFKKLSADRKAPDSGLK